MAQLLVPNIVKNDKVEKEKIENLINITNKRLDGIHCIPVYTSVRNPHIATSISEIYAIEGDNSDIIFDLLVKINNIIRTGEC